MNTVRRLTIVGRSEGLDEVERDLREVASATDAVAVTTDRSAKMQLSNERALERSRMALDANYRAQVQIERHQRIWNQALDVGTINVREHAAAMDLINAKYNQVAATQVAASRQMSGAMGLLRGFGGGFVAGFATTELLQLPGAIRDVVAATADMGDAADKIGITTTALQELRFAGQLAGVEANQLDTAMAQFSKRTAEAAGGTGPLVEILKLNNVALREADGTMRPLTDLLGDYANLVRGATSEQQQLLLATEGFGRSGGDMVNLLREGGDAMREQMAEASRLGGVLGDDLVESARRVDDQFEKLTMQIGTFFKASVLDAVATMDALIQRFNSLSEASGGEVSRRLQNFQSERAVMLSELERFQTYPTGPDGRIDPMVEGQIERAERRLAEIDAQLAAIARIQAGATAGFRGVGGAGYPTAAVAPPPTVMPVEPDKEVVAAANREARARKTAENAVRQQQQAVRDLIGDLEFERSLLGKSETEQRIANELRRAGAAATLEQRQRIVELVQATEQESAARDQLVDRMDSIRDTTRDVLGGIASDFRRGAEGAEIFLNALDRVLDRMLDMALDTTLDALFGPSGTAPGGAFGRFFPQPPPTASSLGLPSWQTIGANAQTIGANAASFLPFGGAAAGGGAGGAVGVPGSVQQQVWDFFSGKGLQPHQVAGIMGNVQQESGFNPRAVGDAGNAFGLFQHNDRSPWLFNAIGGKQNLGDVQGQLDFAWKELRSTERRALEELMASSDVRGATAAFGGFERPEGFSWGNPQGMHGWSNRLSAAEEYFQQFGSGSQLPLGATALQPVTEVQTLVGKTVAEFATPLNQLTTTMGQTVSTFNPQFGGILQQLLQGMGGQGGGLGGILGGMFGGGGGTSADWWSGTMATAGGASSRAARSMNSMAAGGGININVNPVDRVGVSLNTKARRRSDGGVDLDVIVDQMKEDMEDEYGVSKRRVRR